MDEEVTQKTIALSIKAGKLTADVLKNALRKFLAAQKQKTNNPYKFENEGFVGQKIQSGKTLTIWQKYILSRKTYTSWQK